MQSLTCCSVSEWPERTDLCLHARTPPPAAAAISTHPFFPAEGPSAGLCVEDESLPRHQVLRAGLPDGRGKWGDICRAPHASGEGGTGPERNRKDADGLPAAWVRRTAPARQAVRPCCRIMPCSGVTEPDAHALSTQPQVTGACTSPTRGNCATISGMHAVLGSFQEDLLRRPADLAPRRRQRSRHEKRKSLRDGWERSS